MPVERCSECGRMVDLDTNVEDIEYINDKPVCIFCIEEQEREGPNLLGAAKKVADLHEQLRINHGNDQEWLDAIMSLRAAVAKEEGKK